MKKMNHTIRFLLLVVPVLLLFTACQQNAGNSNAEEEAAGMAAPGITMVQVSAPGMHCDGCTATVEETLAKMQGVDSVHADLESKEVTVYCDTTQTARAALVGMIDRLGFSEAPGK